MKEPKIWVSALLNFGWVGLVFIFINLEKWVPNMEMVPNLIVRGILFLAILLLFIFSVRYDKRLKKIEREQRKTNPVLDKLVRRRGFIVWTSVILGLYLGTAMVFLFMFPHMDTILRWIIIPLYVAIDLVATIFFVRFLIMGKPEWKKESSEQPE